MARQLEMIPDVIAEIYVINIKPAFRDEVIEGIRKLDDPRLKILEVGRTYEW
jgi:hypothetical protein